MAPHALPVSSKTTSEVDVTSSSSFSLIKANPFGLTTDPQEIKTPLTLQPPLSLIKQFILLLPRSLVMKLSVMKIY